MEQLHLLPSETPAEGEPTATPFRLDEATKATARRGIAACRAALAQAAARQAGRQAA